MTDFQEIELAGYAGTLAAKRWHQGGRPCLALHGWLDNAGTFDGLAPLLPELDLVCLDVPGHGHSYHHPPGTAYHFVDWVPEVFCAADSLGWETFTLLGHSMGAGITCLAAGTFPERVNNLVLIEGIGPYSHPDEDSPAQLRKALLHKPSGRRHYYPTKQAAIERLAQRELEPHSAECLAHRGLSSDENGWYFHYAPEARAPSRARLSEAQVRAFLKAITCPTLLIEATDGLKGPETYHQRDQFIADIQVQKLSGRHHLHLDNPEPCAEQIRDFLRV